MAVRHNRRREQWVFFLALLLEDLLVKDKNRNELVFTENAMQILWLYNSDTANKFVFSEAYRDDRKSTYTIVDRVNSIDEIINDAAGFKSNKLPQDEANRIERFLKGGADSDIDSDEELVENEEVSDEDSSDEHPRREFQQQATFLSLKQCRILPFDQAKQFNNRRLINHLIQVVQVPNESSCRVRCYVEPNCDSYNFRIVPSPNGNFICELNNSTHERHGNELVKNITYKYQGAESACENNPCKNGGTCQTGFTERGYRCLCSFSFIGHDCEQALSPRYETIGCFRDQFDRAIPSLEEQDPTLNGFYTER
ncbi:uncharacterized protein [Montipora capricornis]|uniref:uncharacterized protein n=1 Tax=Montipora capricornis TaxID=246305 RepID=UPI0035F1D9B9